MRQKRPTVSNQERVMLILVEKGACTIDDLHRASGLTAEQINVALKDLRYDSKVEESAGRHRVIGTAAATAVSRRPWTKQGLKELKELKELKKKPALLIAGRKTGQN